MKATTISKKLSAADALTAQIELAQTCTQAKSTAKKAADPPKPIPAGDIGSIDSHILTESLRGGLDDPRFSAVSTPAKSVLIYLNSTVPKFSTSALVRRYVETGLATDYPDLWAEVTQRD